MLIKRRKIDIIMENEFGGYVRMLAQLKMELISDNPELSYYQGSNMQGVLMEQLDTAYAEKLHEQGWKPYSQYVENGNTKQWIINTLTKEAYENIILPLMSKEFSSFLIEKRNIRVKIIKKSLKTEEKSKLIDEFYKEEKSRYLTLEFLTPTGFKSNGRYVIIPDLQYIYQSLMNKYSASSIDMDMYDEDTLQQLVANSEIVNYKLKSTIFPLEGIKIPSFKGEITIRSNGSDTMGRYVKLLGRFGEYSGVGIKTAMGMGAVKIRTGREKNDRYRS